MFLGQWEKILKNDRRLRLPSKHTKDLKYLTVNNSKAYPMILVPANGMIRLWPFITFQNSNKKELELDDPCWIRNTLWTKEIENIVGENNIYPCHALYKSNKISGKVRDAINILKKETKKHPKIFKNISGKDFEKILYEILNSLGVNIQLNVHVLGAEIDLLLLEMNKDGKVEFTIIECKHRWRSQRVVNISQVMRLFGLKEALKKDLDVKNALIVSTTGFSSNAKQFAKVYKIDLFNYQGFLEWITEHNLFSESINFPIFKLVNLDQRGRFNIPKCLVSFLRFSGQLKYITIIGLLDCIEIWNSLTWQESSKKMLDSYEDTAVQIYPSPDI